MQKSFIIFISNLCLISSFIHNTNTFFKHSYNENYISKLKLTRYIDADCNNDLKYKHWKNIFKYLNNKTYNTNYCKWFYNKNQTTFNSSYNFNYLTSFNYNNNSIYYNKLVNYNNFNYKKFKKINYHNNTHLYLIDNNIKLSICNSLNYIYNINIIHPFHSNCRFSIKIIYNLISNDINSISLYRHCCGENHYWNNDNDNNINILHSNNFKNDFLFGRYISLDIPFKIYHHKNKFMLYDYKYPHLYEIKKSKDNIIFQLPDNILLEIPKLITSYEKIKIKLSWSFKDDTEINILDIDYLNNTVDNVALFTFI